MIANEQSIANAEEMLTQRQIVLTLISVCHSRCYFASNSLDPENCRMHPVVVHYFTMAY